MSKSQVNLTKESIVGAVQQGATSISQVYKMLGGQGNVSGSTTKKIRQLMPDIQVQLDVNKGTKPVTDNATAPTKASKPSKPTIEKPVKAKPTTPKPAKQTKAHPSKYSRHKSNPFRENSAYATCFDILAAHKDGIGRDEILNLIGKETHKDIKHAGYDLSVLLSAKESPTGPRHRSCREGFWVKREHHHYTLMLL
jgi:bacterioferritin-associated ferredoxin